MSTPEKTVNVSYKLQKGDNYDSLVKKYGATLLGNAGIWG
jgi:hypothetical protein